MFEQTSPEAAAYHQERKAFYINQGDDVGTADWKADMDLLEWSQPLPLPDMDMEELWT